MSRALPAAGIPRKLSIAFLLLSPFLFGLATLALGQDASWDTRNYHIYNAWAFLSGRYAAGLDIMPSQGQFFFNPLLDVPFYLLATLLPVKWAYFILGCLQGLNIPLVFMIAHATLAGGNGPRKSFICAGLALLGACSGMGIALIGANFNDNLTSLGILLTALLVVRNIDEVFELQPRESATRAALYGLPAGLALGLKLTCLPFCLGICVAALVLTPDWRKCLPIAISLGLGITAGFVITYGHWGYFLWREYGSPMFPFFNAVFRSPLLPPGFFLDYATPRDISLFFFPFHFALDPLLVNEILWSDLRVPILYALLILLPIWYFVSGRKTAPDPLVDRLPARFLLLTAGVAYYGWLFTQTIYRYLQPLDLLAPLMIVAAIGMMPARHSLRLGLTSATLLIILCSIRPGDWGRHKGFHDSFAQLESPALPSHATVILAGQTPYAYLLPGRFPADTRFIRIESRGFPASERTGLRERIGQALRARGPRYLFAATQELDLAKAALGSHGLRLVPTGCQTLREGFATRELEVAGHGYPADYTLCPVEDDYVKKDTNP
ncbi:MAG TPA: hypothetical protein VEF76_10995 [Patescibacteria group bacterium]|nr:hypothetical protein [Patescibacteria group bacterium]